MPYSRITPARDGRGAIAYAKGGKLQKGHNDNDARNMAVSSVNLLPESVMRFEEQMQQGWNKASSRNKTQIRRIIQSYSRNELDPNNQNDILLANKMGREFVEIAYPNHQAIVFTQVDGESGLIHNHILVLNVNMETYKGCLKEQTCHSFVKEHTDAIAEKYIILDKGQAQKDKVNQTERKKREAGDYVWKDDMKNRILEAKSETTSRDDFCRILSQDGVEVTFRKPTKRSGEFILYELKDTSNFPEKVPQNLKSKSFKMGTDYDIESVDEGILTNSRKKVVQSKVQGSGGSIYRKEQEEAVIDDIAQEIIYEEPPEEIIEDIIAEEIVDEEVYEPPEEIIQDMVAEEIVDEEIYEPPKEIIEDTIAEEIIEDSDEELCLDIATEERIRRLSNTFSPNNEEELEEDEEIIKTQNTVSHSKRAEPDRPMTNLERLQAKMDRDRKKQQANITSRTKVERMKQIDVRRKMIQTDLPDWAKAKDEDKLGF